MMMLIATHIKLDVESTMSSYNKTDAEKYESRKNSHLQEQCHDCQHFVKYLWQHVSAIQKTNKTKIDGK